MERTMFSSSYSLRPATIDDRVFVYELQRDVFRDHVIETWGAWDEEFQQERFAKRFDPEKHEIIGVEGADAGVLSVERKPGEIFLASIGIAADYQRRGIGTAIIQDLFAEADGSGAAMTLQVLKVNSARQLYERLGFVADGETDTHFKMRRHWPETNA